jgi:hypothetical protein
MCQSPFLAHLPVAAVPLYMKNEAPPGNAQGIGAEIPEAPAERGPRNWSG